MTDKSITAKELEELFGKVDLEKLVRDEVLKESAEEIQRQYDRHFLTTLYGSSFADGVSYEENGNKYMVIPSENYEYLMEPQDNSFFGKIRTGWKAFYWSYQDWLDAMVSEDYVKEFFHYLGSCADL